MNNLAKIKNDEWLEADRRTVSGIRISRFHALLTATKAPTR